MAEIKIEKKKPIWPWIVALLLIAGVVYYVFFKDHETNNTEMTEEIKDSISLNNSAEQSNVISWSKGITVLS
jgi:L-rhamnose mutarotase